MKATLSFFLLLLLMVDCIHLSSAFGKIHKKDLQAITLTEGRYTTGRRTNPIPQLTCISGCRQTPSSVQCYNKGFDGQSIQWKCDAMLPTGVSFGSLTVSCEGYEYKGDPYVTVGSCGLKYSLVGGSSGGRVEKGGQGSIADFLFWAVVALIVYFLFTSCVRAPANNPGNYYDPSDDQDSRRSYYGGADGAFPPGGPGFRPFGGGPSTGCGGAPHAAQQPGNGGFWSGAATGGILGYMFGRGTGTGYGGNYENVYRRQARGNDYFSSGGGASTSGYEAASGYGGSEDR